ncbi:MAG: glycoside hydrolase [Candidatus Marinimicrobia bacterium]|nr:glycoside hydrolase [Candidatus Neomarinimicrobiota bacterium]
MNKNLIVILFFTSVFAQIGDLIWEENFNDLDNWIKITGNGSWGWGNGELEYYKEENVSISPIPGDPNNNALHITAKSESGPDITDQWGNPLFYTSGKVISKSNVSIKYGVVEARVRVPNLDVGGWPAVWLLGTSNYSWPRNGELDMMEMGSSQSFRNLHDNHNGGNGLNNSNVNQVVGANAIFYSDAALTADNPSGAASISWDPNDENCRPYYNYENPLNDRFVIYRMYWDSESIRFTIIDNEIEYDLYVEPLSINTESDEFQNPFYLIANLAIGGLFTDANYLGSNGLPISMPMPANMYIDYIKVFEWNNQGHVHLGPPDTQGESLGLFTDNTPTNSSLIPEIDSHIYVWENTLTDGSIPSFEGENGISWTTTGAGWFGAGIMSIQPANLSNFSDGFLKFRIKIPQNISFQIGIIDAWGNQSYVDFPASQTTYGLVRDGNWGQASIPINDIRGELIDLRMLSYEFVILEVNGVSCEFALDDIYWDGGISEILIGDVNNDGFLNVVDVVSIVSIILDNDDYNSSADYNSDGVVNVIDIIAIVDMIIR